MLTVQPLRRKCCLSAIEQLISVDGKFVIIFGVTARICSVTTNCIAHIISPEREVICFLSKESYVGVQELMVNVTTDGGATGVAIALTFL